MPEFEEAYCLFCYKCFVKPKCDYDNNNDNYYGGQSLEGAESEGLQSRFFQLLNRYLKEKRTGSLAKLKLKEFELENVLLQCPDCSSLLQSYCAYFEEIEVLKLKLNWRLGMLAKIVSCSGKVKSRRTCFEQKIRKSCQGFEEGNEAVSEDPVESVKRLRKELVQKCKRILRGSSPQVRLQKCTTEQGIIKVEGGSRVNQMNGSSVLNGGGDFEMEPRKREENYLAPVKIEGSQHSSPALSSSLVKSTSNAKIKDRPDPITTSVEGDTASLDKVDGDAKAGNEPRSLEKGDLELKGDDDDARSRWCQEGSSAAAIPVVTEEIPMVITSSVPEVTFQSTPHSEINLNGIVTPSREEVMQEEFDEAQRQQSPVQLQKVDEPVDEEFAEAEVIDSDSSKPVLGEVEHRPDTIMFEEHFEGPLLACAKAEIENQEQCSEEEGTRTPEEAVQDKEMKSSKDENEACVEPEGQSEAESTARRFSLRTRHKCPKCSVGFTSATSLKLHLGYCAEPESTLDKDSDDENVTGDDDYDELGEGDNCSEDNGAEAAISESDFSHLSEAEESDTGPDVDEERGSGRKRKRTITPSQLPKRRKYAFFQTRLDCGVENCKFFFYKQRDLDNHSKLHGEFKCEFCNVTKTYAPDLSMHELRHKVKLELLELGPNGLIKDEELVQCPRCTSEVQFKAYSKHHLEAHLDLTPSVHTCPVCECASQINKTIYKSKIKFHFRTHHDLEGVPETEVKRCHHDGCSAYFLTYAQLAKHRLGVHIPGGNEKDNYTAPFVCTICNESFATKLRFMEHRVNFHQVGLPVPCEEPSCTSRFENELYMNQHLAFRHRSSLDAVSKSAVLPQAQARHFYCLVCGTSFNKSSKLDSHAEQAHPLHKPETGNDNRSLTEPKAKIQCVICKALIICNRKRSDAFGQLRQHYKAHHDIKGVDLSSPSVLKCDVEDCKAYFLRPIQLKLHQKRSHFDGKYKCASCDHSSKEYYALRKHRVTVHKVTLNFACPHDGCEERCETQADLDLHIDLTHAAKTASQTLPALVCETCGKRFKQLSALKSHRKTHGAPKEPRKFICPKCGKAFRNATALQTHLLCHAGPEGWQFTCETCGKKCMTKQKLEEHQNVHSKAKPFTCEHCGLKYAHRHNFRHHLKGKHGVILETPQRGTKKTTVLMDD